MARKAPHQLGRDQLRAALPVAVAHQSGGFHKPLPLFRKGCDPLLFPWLGLARVEIICLQLMTARRKGLEPSEVYKASINESLTTLA
jgi:hypothetical protein